MIRPALLWCDGRTTAECREITERVGRRGAAARLASQSGARGLHAAQGAVAAQPRAGRRSRASRRCCSPKDYIRYRLTGALATEPSDASATLMYDTGASALERRDPASRRAADERCCPTSADRRRCSARVDADAAALTGLDGGHAGRRRRRRQRVRRRRRRRRWRRARRSRAGERRARCSRRLRSRWSIRGCARTRSATSLPDIWYLMGVVLSAGGAFAWYREQFARELAGASDADDQAQRRGGDGAARARRA